MLAHMNKTWFSALQNALWVGSSGLAIGALAGYPVWGLLIGLMLYLGYFIYQLQRFDRWLAQYPGAQPPESSGLWGTIFDRLYRLQKNGQLTENSLDTLLAKAQAAANMLSDGVISVDPLGNLQWWNYAAAELAQLQSPEDQGRNITHLIREPEFVAYFSRGDFQRPYELRPIQNNVRTMLQIHVALFGDQRLLLIRDISRLHHLQQVRTDFIANVSHELRTPLTVLKGYLETFQDVPEFAAHQAGLGAMMAQAQRMQALIEDLLLLSRLEHQGSALHLEPIDMGALLRALQEEAQMLGQQKKIRITLDMPTPFCIHGSYTDLHSALMNLITNAIKYSPDNTEVQLITGITADSGAFVCVADAGIGIDPTWIPRLTERFFRVDTSRDSSTGGTGLGLAIVKHVLLRHDSRLDISSQPGKGSRFSCVFPKARVIKSGEG